MSDREERLGPLGAGILLFLLMGFAGVCGYEIGSKDYTNELAVKRRTWQKYYDEAVFFHKKWREEELAHIKTQRKLDRLERRMP